MIIDIGFSKIGRFILSSLCNHHHKRYTGVLWRVCGKEDVRWCGQHMRTGYLLLKYSTFLFCWVKSRGHPWWCTEELSFPFKLFVFHFQHIGRETCMWVPLPYHQTYFGIWTLGGALQLAMLNQRRMFFSFLNHAFDIKSQNSVPTLLAFSKYHHMHITT